MPVTVDEARCTKLLNALRAIRQARGGPPGDPTLQDLQAEVASTVEFRTRQLEEEAAKLRLEAKMRHRA